MKGIAVEMKPIVGEHCKVLCNGEFIGYTSSTASLQVIVRGFFCDDEMKEEELNNEV